MRIARLKKCGWNCPLASEESIYGTGERFNELDQTGKRLLMWNVDAGYNNAKQEHSMQKNGEDIKMFLSYIAIEDITLFFNFVLQWQAGYKDILTVKNVRWNFKVLILIFLYGQGTPKEKYFGLHKSYGSINCSP